MRTVLIAFAGWSFAAGVVFAAPPGVNLVYPPVLHPGVESQLRLTGQHFAKGLELVLPFAAEVRVTNVGTDTATVMVKPAANTPCSVYPLRIRTPAGISNLRLVQVTKMGVVLDKEPNNRVQEAQPFAWPGIFAGELSHPSTDVETIRFSVAAGQRLTFATEARQLGLSPDLLLRLRDPRGRELTFEQSTPGLRVDERIDYTFKEPGDYTAEVHIADFNNTAWTNLFCLKVGDFNYAREVFPLGGRRGHKTQFTITDRDGKQRILDAQVPADPILDEWRLPLEDYPGSLAWPLASGDLPELLEDDVRSAQAPAEIPLLPWPVTINGRISWKDEADSFRFAVTPGQQVRVRAEAYFLGSALDGHLIVYDPIAKKVLAQNHDQEYRGNIDPGLDFTVPPEVKEVVVVLQDTFRRGGVNFSYRLTVERGGPDFYLALGQETFRPLNSRERLMDHADTLSLPVGREVKLPVTVRRSKKDAPYYAGPVQGYEGPIRLEAQNVPVGITVKSTEVPAGATVGELVCVASAEAPRQPFEIVIVGEGKREDGVVLRRIAERRLYLAEPASTHLAPNWRSRKVICVITAPGN